jgi:hypothetical protein
MLNRLADIQKSIGIEFGINFHNRIDIVTTNRVYGRALIKATLIDDLNFNVLCKADDRISDALSSIANVATKSNKGLRHVFPAIDMRLLY